MSRLERAGGGRAAGGLVAVKKQKRLRAGTKVSVVMMNVAAVWKVEPAHVAGAGNHWIYVWLESAGHVVQYQRDKEGKTWCRGHRGDAVDALKAIFAL